MRFVALIIAVGVVAAGCSSSKTAGVEGLEPTLAAAVKAVGSTPATISGAIETAGHTSSVAGRFDGDLATGKGWAAFDLAVAGTAAGRPELRWLHGALYVDRVVASPSAAADPRLVRTAHDLPWSRHELSELIVSALPRAFDPPALVEALQQQSNRVSMRAHQKLDGKDATRLELPSVTALGLWTNASVSMWLDGSSRPERVEIRARGGSLAYDIAYGGSLSVSAPPAWETDTGTARPTVALSSGYRTVRSGVSGAVTWSVLMAHATNGSTCWRWQASPSLPALITDTRDGVRCVPATVPSDGLADQVQFVFEPQRVETYDAVVVLLPRGVRSVVVGRVGGALTTVTDVRSPFVFVGSAEPSPAYLKIVTASGSVECGRGAISSVGDLDDSVLTQHVVGSPWAC